jgi:hypothetical protein
MVLIIIFFSPFSFLPMISRWSMDVILRFLLPRCLDGARNVFTDIFGRSVGCYYGYQYYLSSNPME